MSERSLTGPFRHARRFPSQDCSPYSYVHVRRVSLGFVHRSRTIFCRAVPNLTRPTRNCPLVEVVIERGRGSSKVDGGEKTLVRQAPQRQKVCGDEGMQRTADVAWVAAYGAAQIKLTIYSPQDQPSPWTITLPRSRMTYTEQAPNGKGVHCWHLRSVGISAGVCHTGLLGSFVWHRPGLTGKAIKACIGLNRQIFSG